MNSIFLIIKKKEIPLLTNENLQDFSNIIFYLGHFLLNIVLKI